jgi:rubrerythrin
MKKTILTLAITAFMAGSMLTAYGQEPDRKSEKARENLKEAKQDEVAAKQDLKEAQKDSASECQKFKIDENKKITANNKSIADFKVRIAKEKKENRAQYEKNLAKLEHKNTDLKKRLDDFKDNGKETWASFKREFNHDMDALGKSLQNFTI